METSQYIKGKFLEFFKSKHHFHQKHSPLAPSEYDTTMFTIAGMKQFTDIFLGNKIATHPRVVTIQPCLRVNDLDNVGKTTRHHTFFEMLGNFSFGDYFKQDAIAFAYEFLIDILKLDLNFMYFTVYHEDNESYNIWNHHVSLDKIIKIETDDNFWRSGAFGPCGPCTEIYFDILQKKDLSKEEVKQSIINGEDRFLEIWNLVFMQYNQQKQGLIDLPQKCVDTGMGLERICSVFDKTFDNFATDTIKPIVDSVNSQINNLTNSKIVADHLKSSVFLIGEGIKPGNDGQGYVLRNLIRRANVYCQKLTQFVDIVLHCLKNYVGDFSLNAMEIKAIIEEEERNFQTVLQKGKQTLESCDTCCENMVFKLYDTYGLPIEISKDILREKNIQINWDLVESLKKQHSNVSKKKLAINFDVPTQQLDYSLNTTEATVLFLAQFNDCMIDHHEIKSATQGNVIIITDRTCFYSRGGGQEGDQGEIYNHRCKIEIIDTIKQKISNSSYIALHIGKIISGTIAVGDQVTLQINEELRNGRTRAHSAQHIFADNLANQFGYEVCGSFIDKDYFRVDFNHKNDAKFKENIATMEGYTNEIINKSIDSIITEEKFSEIKDARYGDRCNYGEIVRVVNFPGVSKTLCGGTHVKNTSEIKNMKIIKESAVAKGVRRIEAFTHNRIHEITNKIEIQNQEKIIEPLQILYEQPLKDGIIINATGGQATNHLQKINKYSADVRFIIMFVVVEDSSKFILKNISTNFVNLLMNHFNLKGGGKDIIRLGCNEVLKFEDILKFCEKNVENI